MFPATELHAGAGLAVDDSLGFESRLGIGRCVLVQPSVDAADDGALMAALRR